MTSTIAHTDLAIGRRGIRRRDFLRAAAAVGAAGSLSWTELVGLQAAQLRAEGMACILLWMQGGPSQFETFSPKPGHRNGGDTKAIKTSVSGIEISENLPRTAKVMDDICIIRSMTSKEGSHPRATFLLHTGQLPTPTVKYPTWGSLVAKEIGDPGSELPSFVRIGNRLPTTLGAGMLGVEYEPFNMVSANTMPENTQLPTTDSRYRRRLSFLTDLEQAAAPEARNVADHRKLYDKASKMVLSPKMQAFDLDRESPGTRAAYGEGGFAAGCLMARRLIEAGVTMVEVNLGNWDSHFNNAERSANLCGQMDQPYAQLLKDLKQRGMLDKTLVIWMGEFGRTPRINARSGRDHYPRAFNVALAGGGVQGGQVIGKTDAGGVNVSDRPVQVLDLFRTFCHSLKMDADHENMSPIGRPIRVVDGGETVKEVFGEA